MKFRPRLDANQPEIVKYLRGQGFFVQSLASLGGGVPDLLAAKGGVIYLIEIKDGTAPKNQQRLTTKEHWWVTNIKTGADVEVYIVTSLADADKFCQAVAVYSQPGFKI